MTDDLEPEGHIEESEPLFIVDVGRLFGVIRQSIAEIDATHRPDGVSGPRGGCVTCWPQESGWPCVSRMVADDLRAVLGEGSDE